MVKFDINFPNTSPVWIKNFGPYIQNNGFTSICELPNENLLVAGGVDTVSLYDNNSIIACIRLTQFNKNGKLVKNKFYDYRLSKTNINAINMPCISVTKDGGAVGAIWAQNYNVVNPYYFVKYDSTGCDNTLAECANLVGIEKINKNVNDLLFFPNPCSKQFSFSNPQNNFTYLNVYDVMCKQVLFQNLNSDDNVIDVSNLSKGLYFVEALNNKGNVIRQKLIKE
jgi:hypothetical protein